MARYEILELYKDVTKRITGGKTTIKIILDRNEASNKEEAELVAFDKAMKNCEIRIIDGVIEDLLKRGAVFYEIGDNGEALSASLNELDMRVYDAYVTILASNFSTCSREQFAHMVELTQIQRSLKKLGLDPDDYGRVEATPEKIERSRRILSEYKPCAED